MDPFPSIRYASPFCKAGNALVTPLGLRVSMGGIDHLLFGDSPACLSFNSASSSTGDTTPRAKRKYTKRPGASGGAAGAGGDTPKKRGRKKKMILGPDGQPMTPPPKVKGKRGRPRKLDASGADRANANSKPPLQQAKIRVRNNLMPINNEPIPVDSEDEPDLGSPSRASDSLSLDENLRALRHLHEKYANIGKDDLYQTHLLAANFKSPGPPPSGDGYPGPGAHDDDEVLSVRSSPGREEAGKVEKLEDSSDSDSDDSSSSESGSTSSGSSSSSSSGSSSSSDSSDSESEKNGPAAAVVPATALPLGEDRSFGSWSHNSASRSPRSDDSGSGSGAEGGRADAYGDERGASLSESENESPDKSFQCNVCKKWYSTSVTLKIHRRVHVTRGAGNSKSRARSKDRYECDCCDEVFTRREKLLEHRSAIDNTLYVVRDRNRRLCRPRAVSMTTAFMISLVLLFTGFSSI
ncbi:hypothetical protein EVAR_92832_1 [Eumeta japonica]|uniref:C2H2-type domain-containing protein n=1 Tax=Eumeta variegata TaxID=151549 RepID=A0A4C1TA19_EUMVA|nr:hypothetical protein EVAR_92832_1 [Eumeta japonica]